MKAFRVEMSMTIKSGFTEHGLKSQIERNLSEVDLRLLDFAVNENVCSCVVNHKELSIGIPYHMYTLGCFSSLQEQYPYVENISLKPSFIEM